MPIHTVSLTTDAYNRLKKLKHGSESFSDAILREIPDKAETAGELLDLAEARFLGKDLIDEGLMSAVEKGRKRRSNRK